MNIDSFAKFIFNDNEVLDYSMMFNLKDRMKQLMDGREEATIVRHTNHSDGKITASMFCVHTLAGDRGYSCVVISDKAKHRDFFLDFLNFRLDTCGVTYYSNDDDVSGTDVTVNS